MSAVKEEPAYRCKYSADNSSTCSDTSSDSDFFEMFVKKNSGKKNSPEIKTKEELLLDDLPPVEDLNIKVTEEDMMLIGNIHTIVNKLVVVRAVKDKKPLDIDSVVFLTHNKALGRVHDVFGPVIKPYYCVRFNSINEIEEKMIKIGDKVFFVPKKDSITSYVFVDELQKEKGSDASWRYNNEPPEEFLDFSDHKQEKAARRKRMTKNRNLQFSNSFDVLSKKQSLKRPESLLETPNCLLNHVVIPYQSPPPVYPQYAYMPKMPGDLKQPPPAYIPPNDFYQGYEVNRSIPLNHPPPGMNIKGIHSGGNNYRPNFRHVPKGMRTEHLLGTSNDLLSHVPVPYLSPPPDIYRPEMPGEWQKRPLPPNISPNQFFPDYQVNQNMLFNHPPPGMNINVGQSSGNSYRPNFRSTPKGVLYPGTPTLQHSMASDSSSQHSAPSVPQSQTQNLHPALSLVHQPPPFGIYGQPPTLAGHPTNASPPQPLVYVHRNVTSQHPLYANYLSSSQRYPFSASYTGTYQPEVILPQLPHAAYPAAALPQPNHHLYCQTLDSHVGTPNYVLPHVPMSTISTCAATVPNSNNGGTPTMATISTCAAMVPNSNNGGTPTMAISTGHYVPHSQAPHTRHRVVCRYFAAGYCRYAENCSFLHHDVNGPNL